MYHIYISLTLLLGAWYIAFVERRRSFSYRSYGHPDAQEGDMFVLPWPGAKDAVIIIREETETEVRFLIAPGGDILFNRQWTQFFPKHVPVHLRRAMSGM